MLQCPTNGSATCLTWVLLNSISYLVLLPQTFWMKPCTHVLVQIWSASVPNITRYYCTNPLAQSILVLECSADPPMLQNYKSVPTKLFRGLSHKDQSKFCRHLTCFTHPWMLYFLSIQFHPQQFSHDNNVAWCRIQCGRILHEFERVI